MRFENVASICATAVVVAMFGAGLATDIHADWQTTKQMEACVGAGGAWLPSGPGRHICDPAGGASE